MDCELTPGQLEKGKEVCRHISLGMPVVKAAKEAGICNSTFFNYLQQSQDLMDEYTRAREARADARFESIDSVIGELRTGKIDHKIARVQIDTMKWQMGKENSGKYGDKQTQEHTGDVSFTITKKVHSARDSD